MANTPDNGQSIKNQNFTNHPLAVPPQLTQAAPSNCLLLSNMFDCTNLDLRKEPTYYLDIKEQVEDVCKDMGKVEKVWVEQNSPGNVWVMFNKSDVQGAINALQTLN